MHHDISNLEENLFNKLKQIKQLDNIEGASDRLSMMIFFLSNAKSMLANSETASMEEFVMWFDQNSYKFFNEVEVLKDFIDECKSMPKASN